MFKVEKNIFFYWTGGQLPELYKKNVDYTKLVNPDYRTLVVDDDFCIPVLSRLVPDAVDLYQKISIPAVKSDIMRMALLYEFGGWYVDCDMRPRVSLDYWASMDFDLYLFWVNNSNKVSIQNCFLGGRAGHEFFRHALNTFFRILEDGGFNYHVYKVTGPDAVLAASGGYLHDAETRFEQMDYAYIDVFGEVSKGSWTYQECCGIVHDRDDPPIIRTNVDLSRIESLTAFEYFVSVFDRYPATQARNYGKLLSRAGVHYVHKHKINDVITELSLKYADHISDATYFSRLTEKLEEQGDRKNIEKVARSANGLVQADREPVSTRKFWKF